MSSSANVAFESGSSSATQNHHPRSLTATKAFDGSVFCELTPGPTGTTSDDREARK